MTKFAHASVAGALRNGVGQLTALSRGCVYSPLLHQI